MVIVQPSIEAWSIAVLAPFLMMVLKVIIFQESYGAFYTKMGLVDFIL